MSITAVTIVILSIGLAYALFAISELRSQVKSMEDALLRMRQREEAREEQCRRGEERQSWKQDQEERLRLTSKVLEARERAGIGPDGHEVLTDELKDSYQRAHDHDQAMKERWGYEYEDAPTAQAAAWWDRLQQREGKGAD